MKLPHTLIFTAILLAALPFQTKADGVIQITKDTSHLIPVSITGFSGEVASVLEFDLSVVGIEVRSTRITPSAEKRTGGWKAA